MVQAKNSRHRMHVKVGDTVQVISGRDKAKVGEVQQGVSENQPSHCGRGQH